MTECCDPNAPKIPCAQCGKPVYTCERETPVDSDYRCPAHLDGFEIGGNLWVCGESCFAAHDALRTNAEKTKGDKMADGKGCKCAAHSESECGCDADWTPQEVYDLRAENARLKKAIRRIAEQDATLSVCEGNVTVTMDAALTDAEREAIVWCVEMAATTATECEEELAALRGLLARTE